MRTTLTPDENVAALLRRARQVRRSTLKEVVNEALRQGRRQMTAPPPASAALSHADGIMGTLPDRRSR